MRFRAVEFLCVGISAIAGIGAARQPPPDYKGSCTDAGCHGGYLELPVVHDPVETAMCDACHQPAEGADHKFELTEEGGDLCLECHELDEVKVEHAPVAEGQCTTCHDPHGSKTAKLLTADTVGELCEECHDEVTEDLEYLHGPVAAGACTACHNPHGSNHAGFLAEQTGRVCTKCHTDMKADGGPKATVHDPAKESCDACHAPHGADNKMFLTDASPDLCLDCHDGIADLLEEATVTHDAVTDGRGCLGCHVPHLSEHDALLAKDCMDLCLSCHDKELDSDKGKIFNAAAHLADNPNHHGPIQDKDCAACHDPHGGSLFRLLEEAYPARFYAPFEEETYALCFECHDIEMLEEEETDEATGFRNGQQNLHFVHVNREVKGRTCRACHDVHASSQPKHIREAAPFGEWAIPLNDQQDATGGSCQPGCHRRYRYDRETAVGNVKKP